MDDIDDPLSGLHRRLVEAHRTAEAVEAAKKALESARSDVHEYLAELGRKRAATGEQPVPIALARHLYWDFPLVHVEAIGLAIGVPTSRVYEVVGRNQELTCSSCRKTFTYEGRTSRTNPDQQGPYTLCRACKQERSKRSDTEHSEYMRRLAKRRQEHAARILQGDYWINVDGEVVLPDRPWSQCGGCGSELNRVPDSEAWKTGQGVVYRCMNCDAPASYTLDLVTYIPLANN